jgi:hypothetical protein
MIELVKAMPELHVNYSRRRNGYFTTDDVTRQSRIQKLGMSPARCKGRKRKAIVISNQERNLFLDPRVPLGMTAFAVTLRLGGRKFRRRVPSASRSFVQAA